MAVFWSPSGDLNVAHDPSDLPEQADGKNISSGAMVRCKNLRLDERGKARTRDGSTKLNATAISTALTWLEVQAGVRYSFGGGIIYQDETSIASGLATGAWSAIQYNAYNDTALNIFALNGTDRKRIESGSVKEWGLEAPTIAPTISVGTGKGLTGEYNAKYTYVRKVGTVVVAESDPSPAASASVIITDGSLSATITQPSDTQVTDIRLYRTQNGGETYLLDSSIPALSSYSYGYIHDWEDTEAYIAGNGYHFTTTSAVEISDGTGTGASGETGAGGTVAISNQLVSIYDASSAVAGYRLDSDGSMYRTIGSGTYTAFGGEWLLSGAASAYEARATLVSGTSPAGSALSSWLVLSSDRTWTLTTAATGYKTCELTIEIRNATTEAVLDTASVVLESEAGVA
jgi:hypothetical protein